MGRPLCLRLRRGRRLTELLTGAEDGQWVEVEGVVQAVRESGKNISLDLALSDGAITANTIKRSGSGLSQPGRRQDKTSRQRGTAVQPPAADDWRSPVLSQSRASDQLRNLRPEHPFALPVTPVSGLLRFTPDSASHHLVHIRGTVTLAWPGRLLCIQDHLHGLCAQTNQTTPLRPGELADVIGFPIIGAFTPSLTRATYKAAGYSSRYLLWLLPPTRLCAATTTRSWSRSEASLLGTTSLQVTRRSCWLRENLCFPRSCRHNPQSSDCPPGKREPPSK